MNNYFSNIKEIYDSVVDLLEKGLPEEALNQISGSFPEIRDQTIMTYLKGVCYQETGHYDLAEESYRRVILQDPGFISAAEALLYMRDNHLSDGEKAYLCELINMVKPESETLKEICRNLMDTAPVLLSEFVPVDEHKETPVQDFIIESVEEEISLDGFTPKSPMSDEELIFKPVAEKIADQTREGLENPDDEVDESIDLTGKEGDLKELFDTLNAESETAEPEEEEPLTSIDNIHLSPEEEAELEREDDMEEVEFLSGKEEANKLKELLRTLHDRKQKDIEEEDVETGSLDEKKDDVTGPFDTLTMARVYLKQGAFSSALRILKLLKKNVTDSHKLTEIDTVMESVLEGIKSENSGHK